MVKHSHLALTVPYVTKNVPYVTAYLKPVTLFSIFCFFLYLPYPSLCYKTIHCQKKNLRGLKITKTTRLSYFIANRPYKRTKKHTISFIHSFNQSCTGMLHLGYGPLTIAGVTNYGYPGPS